MGSEKLSGLALAGGGAKGAYEVGVVRAMAEAGIKLSMVSGTSIGALNGSIVASAPSLEESARRLEVIWDDLERIHCVRPKFKSVPVYLLYAASVRRNFPPVVMSGLQTLIEERINEKIEPGELGFLSDAPLMSLFREYLDLNELQAGLPFYVAAYKRSESTLDDIVSILKAQFGGPDTPDPEWFHVQSLPPEEQIKVLLASSALPLAFSPKEVMGDEYYDGGLGGWKKGSGNIPVDPLLQAGCRKIYVVHFKNTPIWEGRNFGEVTICEIFPKDGIEQDGYFKDLLGFEGHKIKAWIEQGYGDAKAVLERVE